MGAQENMLKMQMQIRENSNEIRDYLQGLDTWEKEIKKQDNTFAKMKPKQETKLLAPVRSKAVIKKKKASQDSPPEQPKRIRSYDFKSWDKLDVDKMLEEIDAKEEELESQEMIKEQEQVEKDMKKLSLEEKNKGNDHFKAGRFDKSIECYTKGMQYDPSNPILPANRAMGYLKMKKFVESEADCTLALSLDPAYVKAYLRRGAARQGLGKIESAIRDFKDVLKLEPENRQARQELDNIKKQEQKLSTNSNLEADAVNSKRLIQPVLKPVHLRSKKPLRRVPVEEVGGEIRAVEDSEKDHSLLESSSNDRINNIVELEELKEPGSMKKEGRAIEVITSDLPTLHEEKPTIPEAPSTCFQLQADTRKLRSHPGLLFSYLSQLDPFHLPALLKDQLDTELLLNITNSFLHAVSGNEVYITNFLRHLSLAKRFDMAIMFLSRSDKRDLQSLFEQLKTNLIDDGEKLNLNGLIRTYGL